MRKKILWGGLVLPFLSTIAYAVTGGNHAGKIWETEPTIMLLLGVGLIGLAGLGRRMFKHS